MNWKSEMPGVDVWCVLWGQLCMSKKMVNNKTCQTLQQGLNNQLSKFLSCVRDCFLVTLAWLLTLLLPLAMWLATCSHVLFTNQAINHCLSLASEVPLAQACKQLDTGPTGTKTHQGLKDLGQGWSNPLGIKIHTAVAYIIMPQWDPKWDWRGLLWIDTL